jgi:hypothetical protein
MLTDHRRSIVVALALVALGGCQTEGRRDASGRPVQMSEERKIEADETTLNIASFFDRSFVIEVRTMTRDNNAPYDRFLVRDGTGRGQVSSSHVGGQTRWADGEDYWDESQFRNKMGKTLGNLREVREIKHKNAKVGYRAVGTDLKSGATCIVAAGAYDLIGSTADFRTGSFDTAVTAFFCGGNPEPTKFDRMLAELELVQDRGA